MQELWLDDLNAFVRYTDHPGSLPARVYLHGLARSSSTWSGIASDPRLAGHRTVLVDLLGYGLSDKPADFDYRVDSHAGVIERVLDSIRLQRVTVIGHSLGGTIGILLAARRHDLVGVLVVAEANLDPGGGPMSRAIAAQSLEEYKNEGYTKDLERLDGTAAEMHRLASPVAIHRTASSLIELTRPTPREHFVSLDIPRSFLVGEATLGTDPVSGEDGRGLEEAGIEVLVVPKAGHELMLANPEGTVFALVQALKAEDNGG